MKDSDMEDLAFLFPGQGSQAPGMGRELAAQFATARQVFEEADEALGFSLSTLCFEGPADELKRTENTQPAILTVSIAAYRVLRELGCTPAFVAGHSLGEYSALVAADCLGLAETVRLVRQRGAFMQQAVPEGTGAMAALLKLPEEKLDGVLTAAAEPGEIVSAANFNSPDQIVIAGHAKAVARAMELAKAAGAKRAIALPVSAPFHCALMRPAQTNMRPLLEAANFRPLTFPLVNNWQAKLIREPGDARQGLIEQIPNPVRWTDSVRELARQGVKRFVEVGPGSVLLGLCRSIDSSLTGVKFSEPADLENVRAFCA